MDTGYAFSHISYRPFFFPIIPAKGRTGLFPSVYEVGKYIGFKEFKTQRAAVAQWVHFGDFVEKVLKKDFSAIKPLHVELSTTYKCNYKCPWCNCSKAIYSSTKKSLEIKELDPIIEKLYSDKVGILWTGGEPLLTPTTFYGIAKASDLSMNQCLFTNGSLLNDEVSKVLLDTNLRFIRISLNCMSSDVFCRFHGVEKSSMGETVLQNIDCLLRNKMEKKSTTLVGISLVLDSVNISDAINTVDFLSSMAEKYSDILNYIIIRHIFITDGVNTKKEYDFEEQYANLCNHPSLEKLIKSNVDVVFPFNRPAAIKPKCRQCIGGNIFAEVNPSGKLLYCSDRYGDTSMVIGNLLNQGLEEIWASEKRKEIKLKTEGCVHKYCNVYSRGYYFNSIFSQIVDIKSDDTMKIEKWINALRLVVPDIGHSFFI
jgi:sulfatase maturation enzyme AslB (radical SAM superfamily)